MIDRSTMNITGTFKTYLTAKDICFSCIYVLLWINSQKCSEKACI